MELKGNIWKLFIAEFTQRRYFFPVLSIYFLSLPDTTAQQIGLWSGIGYLAEFLFEIPSGYLADLLGHKRMLIVSKLSMLGGVLCFIAGSPLIFFVLGAVLISLSFAAQSGTQTAFLHETLVSLKREKSFVGIASRLFANARLVSALLLILVPLGAQISLLTPLYLGLVLDVVGLVAVLLLANPSVVERSTPRRSVFSLMKELWGTGFYPVIVFVSAIAGFSIASGSYVYPYLERLGFPVAWLGLLAGLSAVGSFIVGNKISAFEKRVNIKRVFLFDLLLFPLWFLAVAFLDNIVLITLIVVCTSGYQIGRVAFVDGYLGRYYVRDKNYMATTLSLKGQTTMLFNFVTVFAVGYVMEFSYEAGFYAMGVGLFLVLLVTYQFVRPKHVT